MTSDRNRLIKSIQDSVNGCARHWAEIIADYLLANGVIVPPCKVGDTVYLLNADRRFRAFIEKIEINADGLEFYWVQYDIGVDCTECWDEGLFTVDDIGKTAFFDETEYLKVLTKGV